MLNIAIIGTGAISNAHIGAYLAFPERCKIVALVDIYPEKSVAIKERYSLSDAEVFDSHKALLGREDIDLVSVCTPPYAHAEIAIDFLNDKKNVIVEKPMAASLEECDSMLDAEKKSGKVLSIIAQNRFRNPVNKVKQVLDTGLIGKVNHVQVDSHWWRGHSYYDLWWRGSWKMEGGGCTLNHAVHHIDMLCWMKGLPNEVISIISNTSHDNAEVEDISIALLKYPDGSVGQVTSSVIHHGEEQQLIFQGQDARVSFPWKTFASSSAASGFPTRNTELEQQLQETYDKLSDLKHEGHPGQIDDVMTAIETNGRPFISGKDGRNTVELITSIYKSGSTNVTVKLPLEKDDPFYTVERIQKNAKHFYEKKDSVTSLSEEGFNLGSDYKQK